MGLFQRISDLLRSNINDLISKAEDPEKLLNTAIEEMQKQIIEAKSRVAMSIADEKRLQKQLESQAAKAADWEKKAMSAVRASRDDLAVEALSKKKDHERAAAQFEEQLHSQRSAVDELKKALTELSAKLDDTKRKRQILLARAKRAEAQKHVAATLAAAGESSAYERLERLEAKIERAEAEAEATWEVASLSSGSRDKDLADEIKLLEGGGSDLDDDLAALKDKMRDMGMIEAGNPGLKALPSGEDEDETDAPTSGDRERAARAAPTDFEERERDSKTTDPELSLVSDDP
jgi:phage shock protein A